jgi:hypothetical protein
MTNFIKRNREWQCISLKNYVTSVFSCNELRKTGNDPSRQAFFLSTFRQKIKKKHLNAILAFICANILYISKVQLFKTHPFRDWFCLHSQMDKRGGGAPQLIGPL